MTANEQVVTVSIAQALKLAHERTEEMLSNLGPRLPADIQQEIACGVEAILEEALSQRPREATEDFMTTAEAAKMLFVSRPHVVKLIDQGQLKLHHITGNNRFVTKDSVLAYQIAQQAAVAAYRASTADEVSGEDD